MAILLVFRGGIDRVDIESRQAGPAGMWGDKTFRHARGHAGHVCGAKSALLPASPRYTCSKVVTSSVRQQVWDGGGKVKP